MRTYGALGLLNYEAFSWWARRTIKWFESEGLDWDRDPRFLLYGAMVIPIALVWSYLAMRLFEVDGEWLAIVTEFDWMTLLVAAMSCLIGASMSFSVTMGLVHYSRNQHPLIAGRKAPTKWKFTLIVMGLPAFFLFCLLLRRLFL